VLTVRGATFLKAESKKDALSLGQASTVSSLTSKFAPDAHNTFPRGSAMVIGVLSCPELCRLYELRFNATSQEYESLLVRSYQVDNLNDRVAFVVAIINIARHGQTVAGPLEKFHLPPGVAISTANKHTVCWLKDGIHKTLSASRREDYAALLDLVYTSRLPNVEWGNVVDERRSVITRVGRSLRYAVTSGQVSKDEAKRGVKAAIEQLHGIGIAHTDIKVDNVFVDSSGQVFLDDLEYIMPYSEEVGPIEKTRNVRPQFQPRTRTVTAHNLDMAQYLSFECEVDELI
jgi:hypothetical protein